MSEEAEARMESDGRRALGTARLMAALLYAGPLVVFPMVGRAIQGSGGVEAGTLGVLTVALGLVGITDYGVSLFLEAKLLERARAAGPSGRPSVVTAAILVSAFGASLAVYGLVLTFLGAPSWGAIFYILCAVHGLHLVIRWPRYERAAEGSPY